MSGGIMRAVRDEMAAGAHWADWLRAGGTERLARLKAFFARERCMATMRAFVGSGGRANSTAELIDWQPARDCPGALNAVFPRKPSPTGSAPALSLQPETDATGRTVFRLRPVRAPLSA